MRRAAMIPIVALVLAACHEEQTTEPDFASLIVAPRHAIAVGSEIAISTAPDEQRHPVVSGNLIAWDDWRGGERDIYMCEWNGTTCPEVKISTDDNLAHYPSLSDDRLLWTDVVDGKKRLYMCEWHDGTCPPVEVPIGENAVPHMPVASGNLFVWVDTRYGPNWAIFACEWNGDACPEVQIAGGNYYAADPVIDGNLIVWEDGRNGNRDVYACEWSAGTCSSVPIDATSYDEVFPAVSGNRIVWTKQSSRAEIYTCEWATGGCSTPLLISTQSTSALLPDISDNLIVWGDLRSGFYDVYVCEWDNGTCPELQVTTGAWRQMYPAISGHAVVWQDQRLDDGDIYMVELEVGQAAKEPKYKVDQSNDVSDGFGPANGLYGQTITPRAHNLARVDVLLIINNLESPVETTVGLFTHITQEPLGTTSTIIQPHEPGELNRTVSFVFDPPLPLDKQTTYTIGLYAPSQVAWELALGDPYRGGQAVIYNGTPLSNADFVFTTYTLK